ncbi:hypothetical protein EDD21DRAFT_385832 [Dissophora ornata]|nr:hypothetical protein EDD21DRAFT_385832 [Dissophora ornata]
MDLDLSPTKTVPAQLNRTETTSYVIHRTFEDFERLSEMVLRLEHALHAHHPQEHEHPQEEIHDDAPSSATTGKHDEDGLVTPTDGPALKALRVHHPYPGLYQTLLKQFSNVKANQRAFDASSTTHGFNEEGAFERVLELNQYLENVWYWLLPEHTPSQLDLSVEQHEIMHWLKPLQDTAHADGRQMRERPKEEEEEPSSHQSIFLQQYGSMRRAGKEAQVQEQAATVAKDVTTETDSTESVATITPTTTPQEASHTDRAEKSASEGFASQVSLPSLSSSSSASSVSLSSSAENRDNHGQDNQDDDEAIHGKAVPESLRTLSTVASSTVVSPDSVKDELSGGEGHSRKMSSDPIVDSTNEISELKDAPVVLMRAGHRRGDVLDPLSDTKVKRRISISNVFRSLSLPRSSHSRHMSMYETGQKRRSAFPPVPASPTLQEEIVVWNTVTIKNHSGGPGRP